MCWHCGAAATHISATSFLGGSLGARHDVECSNCTAVHKQEILDFRLAISDLKAWCRDVASHNTSVCCAVEPNAEVVALLVGHHLFALFVKCYYLLPLSLKRCLYHMIRVQYGPLGLPLHNITLNATTDCTPSMVAWRTHLKGTALEP